MSPQNTWTNDWVHRNCADFVAYKNDNVIMKPPFLEIWINPRADRNHSIVKEIVDKKIPTLVRAAGGKI